MSTFSTTTGSRQNPDIVAKSDLRRVPPFWARFAADVRPPLWGLVVLAAIMSLAFPIWRLMAGRERYVLHLSDDSFYYFSVAPSIAAGLGPTADGITRTTGWHPLYGFILAGLYRLTSPSLDSFPKQAIALNATLYLLSACFLYAAARRWWGKPAGLAAALLWLTSGHGVYMAAAGLETSTYVLCLSLLLWRLVDLATRPPAGSTYLAKCCLLGLCAALTVLSRTDSILLMPIVALIMVSPPWQGGAGGGAAKPDLLPPASARPDSASAPSWPLRLLGVALFGLLIAAAYGAWILYVWHYTGEVQQGSAAVKMQWRRILMRGKSDWAVLGFALGMWGEFVMLTFFKVSALKWVLTGIPLLISDAASRAERGLLHFLWLVPVVLGLAYGLLLDWARSWYCVPALMTLTLLSAGAFTMLLRARSGPDLEACRCRVLCPLQRLAQATLGLIGWAIVIESAVIFTVEVRNEFSDSSKSDPLQAAKWLKRNAEPNARIGCWHSGILAYYTRPEDWRPGGPPCATIINLDGLNNNDVLAVLRGDGLLNAYWDRIGLTCVIPPLDVDKDGWVSKKMGRFQWQWGRKRLVKWSEAPGVSPPVSPLDLNEQVLRQRVYRIVETR